MDILYESCAGIDVHQAMIAVCVLYGPLTSTRPKRVNDFELILAHPAHMKNIKGQKTDKKDAHWIAKLTRIGLLPKSFVPDEFIQELRELTRHRKHLVETRNREINRMHNILQSGGIKLTTYMEDIMGVSGRNLMNLLINGDVITMQKIYDNVYTSFKKKVPELQRALNRSFSEHHRFMLSQALELYDFYDQKIKTLEERIATYLEQYERELEILDSIPGVDFITASVFIAEVGVEMSQFPTAGHLASWAGLCPGNNESSGKKRSTKIRHGNAYLKKCLCQAVYAARRQKGSPISQRFYQLQARRGPQKATIATAHQLLKLAYFLIANNLTYEEYLHQKRLLETS